MEERIYVEDTYFVHEDDGSLYGYFNNCCYEFAVGDMSIVSKSVVDFPRKTPGNTTFYALPYKKWYIGVVDSRIYRFYKWSISCIRQLDYAVQPYGFYIEGDSLVFCRSSLNLLTNEVTEVANFDENAQFVQYYSTIFRFQANCLAVLQNEVVKRIPLQLPGQKIVTFCRSIVVLAGGSEQTIVDIGCYPPAMKVVGAMTKLNFAYIFMRNGEVAFVSPQLDRKYFSGLGLRQLFENFDVEFEQLLDDFQRKTSYSVEEEARIDETQQGLVNKYYEREIAQVKAQSAAFLAEARFLRERQDNLCSIVAEQASRLREADERIDGLSIELEEARAQSAEQQREIDELRRRVVRGHL